jgi:poly(beta-D-mannuronate) lyase
VNSAVRTVWVSALRCIALLGLILGAHQAAVTATSGASYQGLFDVPARRETLAANRASEAYKACLAVPLDPEWADIPVIKGLSSTEGYGTDRSGSTYAWAVMVLSGRALAGDVAAESALKAMLMRWADAGAFSETEKVHDAYYALKRLMLPTVVAFSILRPDLTAEEQARMIAWIDPLIRKTDQVFDGDVDLNNHRYLADSLLMLWGSLTGDRSLYLKGMDRFQTILKDARADGSLPLETRRGARSLWYMRQSLSSMTVMAEVAKGRNDDLFDASVVEDGRKSSMATILSYWINGLTNPILVSAYSAENYIPGPEEDFIKTDFGFLENRRNGRHYLAFLEALAATPSSGFMLQRANSLLDREGADERPLIDEFIGGNATCFWRSQ